MGGRQFESMDMKSPLIRDTSQNLEDDEKSKQHHLSVNTYLGGEALDSGRSGNVPNEDYSNLRIYKADRTSNSFFKTNSDFPYSFKKNSSKSTNENRKIWPKHNRKMHSYINE